MFSDVMAGLWLVQVRIMFSDVSCAVVGVRIMFSDVWAVVGTGQDNVL